MMRKKQRIADTVEFLGRRRGAPNCVVVTATGLNMHPRTLSPLIRFLQKEVWADVVRVTLNGHRERGNMLDGKDVTQEAWLKNMKDAFDVAQIHSGHFHVPVHAVGFSNGAATMLAAANEGLIEYDRGVYLSPSIRLRPWQQWKLAIGLWLSHRCRISTGTDLPESLRAKDRIGSEAYQALQAMMDTITTKPCPRNINKKTLVILHPDDRLIDPSRIDDFINENSLTNWRVHKIEREKKLSDKMRHIILNVEEVRRELRMFLGRTDCTGDNISSSLPWSV